ncbi:inter-alpha-trypsin inhibitor heavy chain H4-like isoform X12 [Polypterus senegalus]|uniref:inter-alpha-trypsin inhibitor heavy chain H4-like isoform X10 n=1 Tax=Polypterus senegalus TaxID=55291 RepID=UPI0019630E39|nr:inter-alpha-trypsin inhibitor heavy chain H4-like isoform X10 [Polypterus senegalus]XP_039627101.1 inter-alpha-trypsin inhibitor heavy chain H4-like isoform X12 [Polypterus senegalus]
MRQCQFVWESNWQIINSILHTGLNKTPSIAGTVFLWHLERRPQVVMKLIFGILLVGLWTLKASESARPRRDVKEGDLDIYSFNVDCKVTSRYAYTVMVSRVANRATVSKEVTFDVELPKSAFISNFSMTMEGKTYVGVVKKKEEAKQQYDRAVARGESAGLVRVSGRKLEEFKVSVTVAAHSKVTFELTYEELLKRNLGNYDIVIKVSPQQLVKNFKIDVDISESQGISFLDVQGKFLTQELNNAIQKTVTEDKAHISFAPTIDQQRKCPECQESILDGEFIIKYDVKRETSIGNIQIVNGYFVHYFAPIHMPRIPKNVVFVIDRSGSMYGRKIKQTREALLKILQDVNEQDSFGLITFDHSITPWKYKLVKATPTMIAEAKEFVKTIRDSGATNINDAVLEGIQMLRIAKEERQVPKRSLSIIILLTDGDPTSGITDLKQIQSNVKEAIKEQFTLYCLGFGFDVNYNFLEKMALENGGVARRIYEDSDSALQLQNFYEEVASPLLTDVELQYLDNEVNSVTQSKFKFFYNGSEIIVAGQITDNNLDFLTTDIKAESVESALIITTKSPIANKDTISEKQEYIFGDYIERLWAYLTIQQKLSKAVTASKEDKKTLEEEALKLSLSYNFVTPLTSMVVTKPEDERRNQSLVADKPQEGEAHEDERDFSSHRIVGSHRTSGLPMGLPGLSGPSGHVPSRSNVHSYGAKVLLKTRNRRPLNSPIKMLQNSLIPRPTFRTAYLLPRPTFESEDSLIRPTFESAYLLPRPTFSSADLLPRPTFSSVRVKTQDPKFIIPVGTKMHSLCFKVSVSAGTILQLVHDPDSGITINGKTDDAGKIMFQAFSIRYKDQYKVTVGLENITLHTAKDSSDRSWSWQSVLHSSDKITLALMKKNVLQIILDNQVIKIVLHKSPGKFLWLNVLLDNISSSSSGLLGQFAKGVSYVKKMVSLNNPSRIELQGRDLQVISKLETDYGISSKTKVRCFVVDNNGDGLINGPLSSYIMTDLFEEP